MSWLRRSLPWAFKQSIWPPVGVVPPWLQRGAIAEPVPTVGNTKQFRVDVVQAIALEIPVDWIAVRDYIGECPEASSLLPKDVSRLQQSEGNPRACGL